MIKLLEFYYRVASGLRSMFRPGRLDAELRSELESHLTHAAESHARDGSSVDEARQASRREFGSVDRVAEECREAWAMHTWHDFRRDVSFAVRQLNRARGYAGMLLASFVFCIGPCTLVFSLVNSLYLNPGRYPDEGRIVRIYDEFENHTASGEFRRSTSPLLYMERKEESQLIASIGLQAIDHANVQVRPSDAAEFLDLVFFTPSMFDVLGVEPRLGQRFHEDDAKGGIANQVVILTHEWWQAHLDGDPSVVGRTLTINGEPWTIVGIMPEDFTLPPDAGQWDMTKIGIIAPLAFRLDEMQPGNRHNLWYGCYARLQPGVDRTAVATELEALNVRHGADNPVYSAFIDGHPHHTRIMTLAEDHIRDLESTFLLALLMSAFVLVAGSLSIANFVLARNSYRIHEFATRISLGATRGRLVRQLLTEMGVIALVGASLAVGLTSGALAWLDHAGMFAFFPVPPRVDLDVATVAAAFAISLIMALTCGLISLLPLVLWGDLNRHLQESGRGGTGAILLKRYRAGLVLVQSAVACVLLINVGLLARSFVKVLQIDPGYDTERVLYATIKPPDSRYTGAERHRRMLELERLVQELPEVASAGLTNWPPMKHPNIYRSRVVRFNAPEDSPAPVASRDTVSPGYFTALGMAPLRGRLFSETDVVENRLVVVIDEALAQRLFPGQDAVGKRIALHHGTLPVRPGANHVWHTVIGVVNPVRINDLYAPSTGLVYQHVGGARLFWFGFVVKARSSTEAALRSMQRLLLRLEPDVAVGQPATVAGAISLRHAERRNTLYFCLGLAAIALGLALLGVAGVVSYSIAAQKKELGIRLALGASPRRILHDCVAFWLKLAAIGVALGLIIATSLSGHMAPLLYEIPAWDLPAYVIACIAFGGAVSVAAYLAALKVVRIMPLEVLREG